MRLQPEPNALGNGPAHGRVTCSGVACAGGCQVIGTPQPSPRKVMSRAGQHESGLLELYRTDDPRGGAAAWALLAVGMALVSGILLAVAWAVGAW